jgi:hypothetical protein
MCGDTLQGPATAPNQAATETPANSASRADSMAFSRMENRGTSKTAAAVAESSDSSPSGTLGLSAPPKRVQPMEPIAGPSLLGLDQPTPDSIRETTFRGMTTYYPEERGVAWGRIFLTLIFIAGLVALGWWRYKNYGIPGHGGPPSWLSALNRTTPPNDNQRPDFGKNKPAEQDANQNGSADKAPGADQNSAAPSADQNQATSSNAAADQKNAAAEKPGDNKPAEDAEAASDKSAKSTNATDQNADNQSAADKPAKSAKRAQAAASDEDAATKAKPSPAVSDNGDALYRKGEAYLYGQGLSQNCDQAIQYLKSASSKSNAKARSMFGTMYATGHCVPRDLPTSYRWFALALQADPNNSILEKDLTAVWNQMTPPERQLATKMKPAGE